MKFVKPLFLIFLLTLITISASAEDTLKSKLTDEHLSKVSILSYGEEYDVWGIASNSQEENKAFLEKLNELSVAIDDISGISLAEKQLKFSIEFTDDVIIHFNQINHGDKSVALLAGRSPDETFIYLADLEQAEELIQSFMNRNAVVFADVDQNNENYRIYSTLTAMGIIKGYEDNTFRPGKLVTRAEFVAILMRYKSFEYAEAQQTFSDLPYDHFAYQHIETAYAYGYIKGDGSGNFEPDSPIKLEDMYLIIARAFNFLTGDDQALYRKQIEIENVSDYAYQGVNALLANGTISTVENLKMFATREDTALTLFSAAAHSINNQAEKKISILHINSDDLYQEPNFIFRPLLAGQEREQILLFYALGDSGAAISPFALSRLENVPDVRIHITGENTPNLSKYLETNPDVLENITENDGSVRFLPWERTANPRLFFLINVNSEEDIIHILKWYDDNFQH